jgi:hypothetical protein
MILKNYDELTKLTIEPQLGIFATFQELPSAIPLNSEKLSLFSKLSSIFLHS